MAVDEKARAKLAKALGAKGAPDLPALPALGQLLGDVLPRLPDTPWRPAAPVAGRPGSTRQYRGHVLTVRQCATAGCFVRIAEGGLSAGQWYASMDGAILINQAGRQFFHNEDEARALAEATEAESPMHRSYVV